MKDQRMISSAVLLVVLSVALPIFAQKGEEEKGGGQKAPQAQHQAPAQHTQPAQRAQPAQHVQQAQRVQPAQHARETAHAAPPQRTEQTQRPAAPQRAQAPEPSRNQRQTASYNAGNNGNRGGGPYGRISNASYSSHFGHEHHFQMGHPQFVGGYNRFQYGGYWFGYNQSWPAGWGYDDDVYVVYEGGGYYMYDLMHPGIHLSLNIF